MTLLKKNLIVVALLVSIIQGYMSFNPVCANDNSISNDIDMPRIKNEKSLNDIEMPIDVYNNISNTDMSDDDMYLLLIMEKICIDNNQVNSGLVIHNPGQTIGIR